MTGTKQVLELVLTALVHPLSSQNALLYKYVVLHLVWTQ